MQKWEYMQINTANNLVQAINGKRVTKSQSVMQTLGFGAQISGDDIFEFLNNAGVEGWELVSSNTYSHPASTLILQIYLLKRPI